jgi:hypothetical protein
MANVSFSYMYRDGANYKNPSEVIFGNPENVDLQEAEKIIKSKLIDETWFYVERWGLKDLHFTTWDNEIDVTWHEFNALELTDELPTDARMFKQFLAQIPLQ